MKIAEIRRDKVKNRTEGRERTEGNKELFMHLMASPSSVTRDVEYC